MSVENILVLIILFIAILLFISEKIRADVVALMSMVALLLTGILTTEEAFSGFSSPAVITVWSVFIVSGGITRSGIGEQIAYWVLKVAGKSQLRLTFFIMLTVGLLSAVMNNIGAVAILLPAVLTISRKANLAPSKLLIPLAWASLMGGNMTLIGTPPNILASSILSTYENVPTFRFFDFTPMGIIVLSTGVIYMLLIGNRLLPKRTPGGELSERYQIQQYLTEVRIPPSSPLVGQTIRQAAIQEEHEFLIVHIHPHDRLDEMLTPYPDYTFKAGDELHIQADPEAILNATHNLQLITIPDRKTTPLTIRENQQTMHQTEITLAPYGRFDGKSLMDIDFRARFDVSVLAIRHNGRTLVSRLGKVPLHIGDSLLVQGTREKLKQLTNNQDFILLEMGFQPTKISKKAPLAVLILLGVILIAASGLLHISAAMLIGAILMVVSRIITIDEAYQSIEWKAVFLIASMLPMGLAMEKTGTAQIIAQSVIKLIGDQSALAVMMGLFILTALLTEVISNAAATVLAVPIAIDAALNLGANPQTFVMAIVIAASTSFLMPIGHQVNVIIFGPGGYLFKDYTKVGIWLNLILLLMTMIFLPLIWPLYP
ncbi:MAG: hypothetical protein CL609_14855 [Anaerolineaceae bacterium]|nr:hypothetical protein [Anaerolineaceae bacterium]